MTLTTLSTTTLDTIFNLIRRKEAWEKEGKAIKKLEAIYRDEIREASKQLHRTRWGDLMTVQSMTDDHLIATIKVYLSHNHDDFSDVPKKYLDEAKRRDGMLERVIAIETVIEGNALDDEPFFDDDLV